MRNSIVHRISTSLNTRFFKKKKIFQLLKYQLTLT